MSLLSPLDIKPKCSWMPFFTSLGFSIKLGYTRTNGKINLVEKYFSPFWSRPILAMTGRYCWWLVFHRFIAWQPATSSRWIRTSKLNHQTSRIETPSWFINPTGKWIFFDSHFGLVLKSVCLSKYNTRSHCLAICFLIGNQEGFG